MFAFKPCYYRIKGAMIWTHAQYLLIESDLVEVRESEYQEARIYSQNEIDIKERKAHP